MQSTEAPVSPSMSATDTNPTVQRHHWQLLASMVCSFRPDWPIDDVLNALWVSRGRHDFPDLAKLALAAALDPRCKSVGSIRLAAAGLIEL